MSEWFKVLLSLSVSGGLLIAALLLVRPWLRRLPARWRYYIWLPVLLRLLLPVGLPASPIDRLFASAGSGSATHTPAASIDPAEPADRAPAPEAPADTDHTAETPPRADMDSTDPSDWNDHPIDFPAASGADWRVALDAVLPWLGVLWAGVALVLLARKITLYQSFARYVRAGRQEVSDPAVLDRLAEAMEAVGVRGRAELYTHPLLSSPLLMGVLRPCVVLPSAERDPDELRHIFLHELVHCRRRDLLYKWLAQLVLAVHWFNPLVYRMVRELDRACELSCDEAVLRALDEPDRRAYGSTLLAALETGGRYREPVASLTLHENAKQLKERLEAIMKYRDPSRWAVPAALCFAALLCAAGVLLGVYRNVPAAPAISEIPENAAEAPAVANLNANRTQSYNISTDKETGKSATTTGAAPNFTGGSISVPAAQAHSLSVRAKLANVEIRAGDGYRINIGKGLLDHAVWEVRDGTLYYADNFPDALSLSFDDWEDYTVRITVPGDVQLGVCELAIGVGRFEVEGVRAKSFSAGSNSGGGVVKGVWADSAAIDFQVGAGEVADCRVTGAMQVNSISGSLDLDGLRAGSLEVDAQVGNLSMTGCTVDGAIELASVSGGMELRGITAGSLLVDAQVGQIDLHSLSLTGDLAVSGISGGIDLNGVRARNLTVDQEIGSLRTTGLQLSGKLTAHNNTGGMEISAAVAGDIDLSSLRSSINLHLTGSRPADYTVIAENPHAGGNGYSYPTYRLNGESYRFGVTRGSGPRTLRLRTEREFGENIVVTFAG